MGKGYRRKKGKPDKGMRGKKYIYEVIRRRGRSGCR